MACSEIDLQEGKENQLDAPTSRRNSNFTARHPRIDVVVVGVRVGREKLWVLVPVVGLRVGIVRVWRSGKELFMISRDDMIVSRGTA